MPRTEQVRDCAALSHLQPDGLRREIFARRLRSLSGPRELFELLEDEHGVSICLAAGLDLDELRMRFGAGHGQPAYVALNMLAAREKLFIERRRALVSLRRR